MASRSKPSADAGPCPRSPEPSRRDCDALNTVVAEARSAAMIGATLDLSERDAVIAVCDRATKLFERLQAIIDWADLALLYPEEFNSHGVRNLDGPVFDAARNALAAERGA